MNWEIAAEEVTGGQGRLLPDNWYTVDVEEANVDPKENGTQVQRRYGNLRLSTGDREFKLPDGSLFKIGERKAFSRSWWEHKEPTAQQIGQRELAREAIALGLAPKPAKGGNFTMPFAEPQEYADAIRGKSLQIRTKQKKRMRKLADGTKVEQLDEETQQPILDVTVVDWKAV